MSDYEDDFENYDDDFEAADDKGAGDDYEVLPNVAPQPAAPAATPPPVPAAAPIKASKPAVARPMHIPQAPLLSDAQLRARSVRLKAALQKMKTVQLEVFGMDDMFVMSTLSEYDLYCMARGQYSACKVAAVQTNDDAKEEDCQTEEILVAEASSQVPDDRHKMTDAEVTSSSVTARKRPAGVAAARVLNTDPQRELKLAGFMQWAGPVMLAALGMASGHSGQIHFSPEPANNQSQQLCSGVVHTAWSELLAQRPVTCVSLCPAAGSAQLLVAYAPVGAQLGAASLIKDHSLTGKGCLCVWDLTQPQSPQAVLVSEGMPTCCCWVPAPDHHVVIAGMEEGGVCAWDLQEPASRHPTHKLDCKSTLTLRYPSFTSEAHAEMSTAGPIRSVCCVAKQGGNDRSSPCQVLALSAWGDITVYTLSLVAGLLGSSAADVDLGVRIGSKVRLMRLGGGVNVRLGLQASRQPLSSATLPCHCMAVLQGAPGPSTQVLVGSEGCRTLRGSWLGPPPAPKTFLAVDRHSAAATSSKAAQHLPAAVTCLAASPHMPQAFVAGLSSGGVALHSTSQAVAVMDWGQVGSGAIQSICWSPLRPACFMALDSTSVLHYFDLTKSRNGPVCQQPLMMVGTSQQDAVPSLTTCMNTAAVYPGGQTGLPCLAVGYDDGSADVHQLADDFAVGDTKAELTLLNEILCIHTP